MDVGRFGAKSAYRLDNTRFLLYQLSFIMMKSTFHVTKSLLACTMRVLYFSTRRFLMIKATFYKIKQLLASTICKFALDEMHIVEARGVVVCS